MSRQQIPKYAKPNNDAARITSPRGNYRQLPKNESVRRRRENIIYTEDLSYVL